MKKRLISIGVIVCCLAILGGGTIAYFTDSDSTHNIITSGVVDIEILESTLDENGDEVPYPTEPVGVMPGKTVSKIVRITAAPDSAQAWLRVKVTTDKNVHPTYNTAYWTEHAGYHYYNTPLNAGDVTEPLFAEVHFSRDMGNEYQGRTLTVTVTAEAVQTANNTADEPWNVGGWKAVEEDVITLTNEEVDGE